MDKIVKLTGEQPVRYYYFDNYMRIIYERLGGHVEGTDTAYYIQDSPGTLHCRASRSTSEFVTTCSSSTT